MSGEDGLLLFFPKKEARSGNFGPYLFLINQTPHRSVGLY
ncbi:conserved hypothetical protein [delta proteobacterium NaphS2]|nr:conserved hypothetical protein [delta proteobacterium NaphS2]